MVINAACSAQDVKQLRSAEEVFSSTRALWADINFRLSVALLRSVHREARHFVSAEPVLSGAPSSMDVSVVAC